jgi:hypothetical protein
VTPAWAEEGWGVAVGSLAGSGERGISIAGLRDRNPGHPTRCEQETAAVYTAPPRRPDLVGRNEPIRPYTTKATALVALDVQEGEDAGRSGV